MREFAEVVVFLALLVLAALLLDACGGEIDHPGCYEGQKQEEDRRPFPCDPIPAVTDTGAAWAETAAFNEGCL